MIVCGEPLRSWIEARIGSQLALTDKAQFIGRVSDTVHAVIALDQWDGHQFEIHIASERGGVTRQLLTAVYDYVFVQCNAHRVTALIAEGGMTDLVQRFGFQYEGRVREGLKDGRDILIFGMLRSECPWDRNRLSNRKPPTPRPSSPYRGRRTAPIAIARTGQANG